MAEDAAADAVPQYQPQPVFDLRHSAVQKRMGYKASRKRKLEVYAEQVEEEQARMQEEGPSTDAVIDTRKRTKHDTVGVGKVSGRPWKLPSERASALKAATPALGTSWEKKMALRAQRKAFVEHKQTIAEARTAKLTAIRKQKQAAKQRKKEQRELQGTVQKSATNLKKLQKKARKKARM